MRTYAREFWAVVALATAVPVVMLLAMLAGSVAAVR